MKREEQKLEMLAARLQALNEQRLIKEANLALRQKPSEHNTVQHHSRAIKLHEVMLYCGVTGQLLSVWQGVVAATKVEAARKVRQSPEFKEIAKSFKVFNFGINELGEWLVAKKEPKVLNPAQWAGDE